MKPCSMVVVLLAACGALLIARPAEAQGTYRPSRPTISPWLNLYNRNPGPLGNYFTYVRPQMETREALQQQDTRIRQQGAGIQTLGQQVTSLEQQGPTAPTGTGAGFMNYSHYYSAQGRPGTAAAATRRPTWTPPPPRSGGSGGRGGSLGRPGRF